MPLLLVGLLAHRFRVLQGLGGGMVMPISRHRSRVTRAVGPAADRPGDEHHRRADADRPVLGPVIGGVIIDNLSWRWIFYVNVPLGISHADLSVAAGPRGVTTVASSSSRLDLARASR